MADSRKVKIKKKLKKKDKNGDNGSDKPKGGLFSFMKGDLRDPGDPDAPKGGLFSFMKGDLRDPGDPDAPKGGLFSFMKGDLRDPGDPDAPRGGLLSFMKGDLRKAPEPGERKVGLMGFIRKDHEVEVITRDKVDNKVGELDNLITEARKMPPQIARAFLKDAYALREELKNMEVDTGNVAAQAKLKETMDGFDIAHRHMMEKITGTKVEVEEENVGGFFAFMRGDLKDGMRAGGNKERHKENFKKYRQKLRNYKRQDLQKEIDQIAEEINLASLMKGEYAAHFLGEAYALREKLEQLKETEAFNTDDPTDDDLAERAGIIEDIYRFKEEFEEVQSILGMFKEQARKQAEKKAFRAKKLQELKEEQEAQPLNETEKANQNNEENEETHETEI